LNKFILLLNTLKYLKSKQIYYRLYYFIRKKIKGYNYPLLLPSNPKELVFNNFINNYTSFENNTFTFLNLSKKFDEIDWNYSEFGKLWTYNLNYFDYLNQKNISQEKGLKLIYDFIDNLQNIKDGLEPYPTSLRGINWIKFLIKHKIKDKKIDNSLLAQYYILYDNLEYHLLGNHLLENGFSLLWGGVYFDDKKLLAKAKEILYDELNEQILDDGGHFELSPMYHQIIFYRLLDAIQLVDKNLNDTELLNFLTNKASKMQCWLKNITFSNGEIPLLNDSANKIAPTSKQLFDYCDYLNISKENLKLIDSGYRKITKNNYECIVDIGKIGPDYIPGHAHADTFSFVLNIDNKPFIVDTGISTYEIGEVRDYERSTNAHNTIEINDTNSSQVWGGFRVANRAEVFDIDIKNDIILAKHNGYKNFGIIHQRTWQFSENKIIIIDNLNQKTKAVFRLHFHPKIIKQEIKNKIKTNKEFKIVQNYIAFEYNKRILTNVVEIEFEQELKVEINI